MATKTYHSKPFTVRCRAFSSEGVRENRVYIDTDGTVRVYDSVAGHYVATCHALSASAERRIRKMAEVTS